MVVGHYMLGQLAHPLKNRSTKQNGMRCKCGYDFARHITERRRGGQSFAVVNHTDYQTFLKLEAKVLRARRGSDARLRAIGRSSEYIGCLHLCPKCSRLLLLQPGADLILSGVGYQAVIG